MQKGRVESSWFKAKAMARGIGTLALWPLPRLWPWPAAWAMSWSRQSGQGGSACEHMRKGKGSRECDIWGREWLK